MYQHLSYKKVHLVLALLLLPIALILALNTPKTLANIQVQSRYDKLSNSSTGVTSTHTIGFTNTNYTTLVGSILIQFCDNGSIIGTPCNFPGGMDISSAILSSQAGNSGYSISSLANGQIILTRNPSIPNASPSSYSFSNIVNPTSPGEYWVRVQTFSSIDTTGPFIEQGGMAIGIISALTISSIVPPYLTFCAAVSISAVNCGSAAGNQINFGDFSAQGPSTATSQFVVATNAQYGFNVSVHGDTMTSGNFTIPNLKTPTPSKVGNSQFGINVVANSSPRTGSNPIGNGSGNPTLGYSTPNYYSFNDGDPIVSSIYPSDFGEYTATYLVNVSGNQPEGIYATTINYICLANF
jgi:hypothetical protein